MPNYFLYMYSCPDTCSGVSSLNLFNIYISWLMYIDLIRCHFLINCSVDDGFPTVKFHFENSLSLMVYPHDYLFHYQVSLLIAPKWTVVFITVQCLCLNYVLYILVMSWWDALEVFAFIILPSFSTSSKYFARTHLHLEFIFLASMHLKPLLPDSQFGWFESEFAIRSSTLT